MFAAEFTTPCRTTPGTVTAVGNVATTAPSQVLDVSRVVGRELPWTDNDQLADGLVVRLGPEGVPLGVVRALGRRHE